ncbi:MAG: tetraacyldisaccharide 4'-kinase, partial [Candidatus Kapaibacterium sp.]
MSLREYLLAPVSGLYRIGNLLHRLVATSGTLEVPIPVISVGGISAGGSGKTPFVRALIELLQDRYTLIILTRGYGRGERGDMIVEPGKTKIPSSSEIGDEPSILARSMKRGILGVGRDRGRLLNKIMQSRTLPPNSLVLLDDGFQHYRLARDLDIVMVDESTASERFLLPAGYLREPPSALSRADVMVISGERGEAIAREFGREETFLLKVRSVNKNPINYASGDELPTRITTALLVTGIARSERVAQGLSANVLVKKHCQFRDHHNYTEADVKQICKTMADVGGEIIVTTE